MRERFLLDTDVLVEYLRGRAPAIRYLEEIEGDLHVSVITVAELFVGARQEEEDRLSRFLDSFTVLDLSREISELGGRYRRVHGPTHGTGLADALIAATAARTNCVLVTFNDRHFPMLDRVAVPYER
ncbi:MAG: type II toxin-antitoxin system VapC family toxin [Longimicrobiales bacterium]|nr:type II toxin-antitoxin system VapC family toxin [Longimicrobiales bacterium]